MSGDGTTDRGAKPPRTLFSLGRPGPKSSTAEVGAVDAPADPAPVDGAGDAAGADVELACGACGTTLVAGAAFCGECGTPVAQLDDEPFDLVEEVPMGDLEDADFGEYVEELPIDDVPAVLYADADVAAPVEPNAAAADDDGAGATVIAQPAAVLYADPSQAEPLPPAPTGTFEISEPSYGTADSAIRDGAATTDATELPADQVEGDEQPDHDGIGAAPFVAGAAVGGAVLGSAVAAGATEAGAAATDAEVLADLAATTDVASGGDAAAAETAASPWADAPTTAEPAADAPAAETPAPDAATIVAPAAVPIAGVAAAGGAGTPAAPVAAASYDTTPPASGGGKSKTGLLVGVAAAVVLVLIVGGIIIASSGNKDGAVQTAQSTSTAVSSTTAPTSTSEKPTTSSGPTTTVASSTSNPTTTDTTAVTVTTVATPVPTAPRPTVTVAPPTTAVQPGRIVATPAAGSSVSIPKGGSTTITLQNVGGSPAGCTLTGSNGISASQDCSPTIPVGGTVTVVVTANPSWEGPATVTGVLEGAGSYVLTVNVQNR